MLSGLDVCTTEEGAPKGLYEGPPKGFTTEGDAMATCGMTMGSVVRLGVISFALTGVTAVEGLAQTISSSAVPQDYEAIDGKGRAKWVGQRLWGSATGGSIFSSAIRTGLNNPEEYGPGWEGFGKRYGMSLAGNATSDTMEAGIGALWHEDPRYFREGGPVRGHIKSRSWSIIRQTFTAKDSRGQTMPAYSRYMGITGSNFLANTYRADSESQASDAAMRTLYGFLGRMAGNAFQEFWPDIKQKLRRH